MVKLSGSVKIVVVATGTTALCIILGIILVAYGDFTKDASFHQDGWNLIELGIAIPFITTGLSLLKKHFF